MLETILKMSSTKRKDQQTCKKTMMLGFLACSMLGIFDTPKSGNPEIWKIQKEMKSLHSLNSAIKELVHSFFNFDSEETSRISDKRRRPCNKKDIRVFP